MTRVLSRPRAAATSLVLAAISTISARGEALTTSTEAPAKAPTLEQKVTALSEEVAELKALVHQLQDQLAAPAPAVARGARQLPRRTAATSGAMVPAAARHARTFRLPE